MSPIKQQLDFLIEVGHVTLLDVFIWRVGKEMTGIKRPTHIVKGKKRQCFKNAARLSWRVPDLTYCEGYCMMPEIPFLIHHAWCIDAQGNVIDNTLDATTHYYFGVEFTDEILNEELMKSGTFGVLSLDEVLLNHELMERLAPDIKQQTHAYRTQWQRTKTIIEERTT